MWIFSTPPFCCVLLLLLGAQNEAFNIACPIRNAFLGPTPFQPPEKSLENKVIVITGGNSGLGLESAKRLLKAGASVVITSRSLDKGEKSLLEIQRYCDDNKRIYALPLDLCNLQSVKDFPEKLKKLLGTDVNIDILLNNAGVMAVPKLELTQDNYEKTFQTNHLGHFALTALLFPMLSKNGARVITVASSAHTIGTSGGLDLDNLNGEKSYDPWSSYGASKLENILFTKELQRRAKDSGNHPNFKAFALHPGVVRTDLWRYLVGEDNIVMSVIDATPLAGPLKTLALLPAIPFTKSVENGATTQVWLASGQGDDVLLGGEYLDDCRAVSVSSAATDADKAKQLWRISEQMSGVEFKI